EDGIRDRNVTGVQTCALPIFEQSFQKRDGGKFNLLIIENPFLESGGLLFGEFSVCGDIFEEPEQRQGWAGFNLLACQRKAHRALDEIRSLRITSIQAGAFLEQAIPSLDLN